MGTVVIGGLLSSTLLTLMVVPAAPLMTQELVPRRGERLPLPPFLQR
jgi:Cu/Ag efflux pump CusA